MFIAMTPEGDPAQHLVEEVLLRAAKKAGTIQMSKIIDVNGHHPASLLLRSIDRSTIEFVYL